jgi:hypothetical protein
LLQKQHSVVKIERICLTRRINLNSLSTQHGSQAVFGGGFMKIVWICAAVAVSALMGCAALDLRDDDVVVKERAQARWDALVKGDTRTAYQYLSPTSRAVLTPEAYAASLRQGFWKSAKVDSVTCATKDSCDAQVTIEYEFQGRRMKTPSRETWIRDGSEWSYLQR